MTVLMTVTIAAVTPVAVTIPMMVLPSILTVRRLVGGARSALCRAAHRLRIVLLTVMVTVEQTVICTVSGIVLVTGHHIRNGDTSNSISRLPLRAAILSRTMNAVAAMMLGVRKDA